MLMIENTKMAFPETGDVKVLEIQQLLRDANVSMTMGYRKGKYECVLRPNYHANTNVVLGRADTHIEAMREAFNKMEGVAHV